MATNIWTRTGQIFPHDGSQPLTQNALKIYERAGGATAERQRLDIELSVVAGGSGSGVVEGWWTEVIVSIGIWANTNAVVPALSPTPLSNADDGTRWLLWDVMHAEVQVNDTLTPSQTIAWKYSTGDDETRSRFTYETTLTGSLWVAWEIDDGSGVINTTIGGIAYNLGGWFAIAALDSVL